MSARKQVFNAVRKIMGRGFRQKEVAALDIALDDALVEPTQPVDQQPGRSFEGHERVTTISAAGIDLIKSFEGCAWRRSDGMIEAYPDPGTGGEPWTIGWGATGMGLDGQRIGPGTTWSQEQCDVRLEQDLVRYAADVARALGNAPATQTQFDAMVSFHYNTGAIGWATLTKKHIARDYAGAAREFDRWNKAGGRVLNGLVRRRAAERRLYES